MFRLNHYKIKEYFLKLTGITEESFAQQSILENAAEYIEHRITRRMLSEAQADRCEYAAAVCAAYDYILSRNLEEKIVITQDGNAVLDYKDDGSISAALELKKSVLDSIQNIIRTDNFSFSAIGGIR